MVHGHLAPSTPDRLQIGRVPPCAPLPLTSDLRVREIPIPFIGTDCDAFPKPL